MRFGSSYDLITSLAQRRCRFWSFTKTPRRIDGRNPRYSYLKARYGAIIARRIAPPSIDAKMVLSNKKLKQKLRAALVESLAQTDGSAPSNQESLKQLLASATKRPVLSKRQKRRKVQSLRSGADNSGEEQEGVAERSEKSSFEEVGGGTSNEREDKRLKKKRKRGEESKSGGLGEEKSGDDLSEKAVKNEEKKKRKKKKKVKKKKKDKSVGAKEKETNEAKDDEKETVTEQGDALTQANRPFLPFAGQETEDVARKVYVGGIPYYSSEDDIRSYFEGCGTITEIDCMTFPESGKFRGIAIIGFKTEAAAKRALAFDGSDMGGFFLTIQPYKATRSNRASNFTPPTVEGYNRIYLGNLSWDITEDDVRKFLSDCNISSIRFGMDKETGEFRGYAHVDFSDSHSMVMAMKLDQQILCGRPAKVTSAILKDSDKSQSRPVATHLAADNKSGELSVISGKIKGRKCYTCNEKGHLFSACPKKPAIPNGNVKSHSTPVTTHIVADNNSGELSVISGKIRGRKCYICNEKGHLSSACPEKPADGLTTPVAT